jgi:hypothetical protein
LVKLAATERLAQPPGGLYAQLSSTSEPFVEPAELVAIMAAIIYAGRRDRDSPGGETRQAAVDDAWKIWELTMDEGSGSGHRPFGPTLEP